MSEKRFVYLLWGHGEHGPLGTAATLDVERLPELARLQNANGVLWDEKPGQPTIAQRLADMRESLEGIPQVFNLMPEGWGGLHVEVVELDSPPRDDPRDSW